MKLDIQQFSRKPFVINAVQLTLDNVQQVAEWCGGTVDKVTSKILGGGASKITLPVVKIKGHGSQSDKTFTATLGSYVGELNGSFRVYNEQQMRALFDRVEDTPDVGEIDNQVSVDIVSENELRSTL